MQAIAANYEVLHETMEKSSHGTDDCSWHGGVLALMERFSTYFGLKLSILIFGFGLICRSSAYNFKFSQML